VSGRGDLFEQTNQTGSLGLVGRYRTQALDLSRSVHATLEAGVDGRIDLVGQSQSLIDASVHNQVWDQRVHADLRLMQLGTFLDLDAELGKALTLRGGFRIASQSYESYDYLGNRPDPTRPTSDFLPGYRSTATGAAVLPRTSLELRASPWLSFLSSYGKGYRSAQAALLAEGQSAPLSLVDSADAGVRVHLGAALDAKVAELTGQREASEAARDARIAALEADLSTRTRERDGAEARASEQEQRAQSLQASLSDVQRQHESAQATASEQRTRIEALDAALSEQMDEASDLQNKLTQRGNTIAALEADLAATRQHLSEATSATDREKEKVQRARQKWHDDQASLERAKDALAAALAQLEETETRPLD